MINNNFNLSALFSITNNPNEVFDIPDAGDIAVVLCHFNPCSYESPILNLQNVLKWLLKEKLPTYAIELRCGHSLTLPPILPSNHPKVIQLKSNSSIFRKDNLWNIIVNHLPKSYKYVLCIDADTILIGENWQQNLLQELKNHKMVQPFSKGVWTDSIGKPFKEKMSCGYAYGNNKDNPQISKFFHSGFAIAVHRNFWDDTAGMFNSPIGGGSLFLMSAILGLPNELEPSLKNISNDFLQYYLDWAKSIYSWTNKSFGYIDCEAWHLWHGSRQKRKYAERFDRLKDFKPIVDIVADNNSGLHEWSLIALTEKKNMVESVEEYFNTREEDEWFISE